MSEVDENRVVVRRWIETFNNPYTPQTEVDDLAPGYIAHAPGLPGPLDLEGWSQFTAAFVEAFPDLPADFSMVDPHRMMRTNNVP